MSKGTVLVSGVTGFIGAHVARELLANGYNVRGTVRNLGKKAGKEHLERWQAEGRSLELVEARLLDEDSWVAACAGVDFVLHVASPFLISVKESEVEDRLYKPAVQGTLNVLKAAAKCQVKKIVVTSSDAAIKGGHDGKDFEGVECETIWTNVDAKGLDPYFISKTRAERAAWAFVKDLQDAGEPVFELTTICPCFVLGPPVSKGDAVSHEYLVRLLSRGVPLIPDLYENTVDVRDIAKAHRLAMESDAANGQRLVCAGNDNTSFFEWTKLLKNEFSRYGYRFPSMLAPRVLISLIALFVPDARELKKASGRRQPPSSNAKIKRILGMEFIDENQTLLDHFHGVVQVGVKGCKMTRKYRAALDEGKIKRIEK